MRQNLCLTSQLRMLKQQKVSLESTLDPDLDGHGFRRVRSKNVVQINSLE